MRLGTATSKDGTRVPVFVAHKRGLARTGATPTLLFGYGGFYAGQRPSFSPLSAAWIEAGGVYALAILRGGSEFGEPWHRAGMLTNKQHVFDDFIAASEWLIAERYASPATLGIRGTSNGGLLVGAALTQRPELYRAVFCGFPDVDILRFNQFTTNNNMPALLEYGDAAIKAQFDAIKLYSPYQRVQPKTAYPAVMLASGDLDTRVPPLAAAQVHGAAAGGQHVGAAGVPALPPEGRARRRARAALQRTGAGNRRRTRVLHARAGAGAGIQATPTSRPDSDPPDRAPPAPDGADPEADQSPLAASANRGPPSATTAAIDTVPQPAQLPSPNLPG